MKLQLRLRKVDHDGYCGRDHHPTDGDVGLVLTVVKTEAYSYDSCKLVDEHTPLAEDWETTFICKRPDGTMVDVMPHEVERLWIEGTEEALMGGGK